MYSPHREESLNQKWKCLCKREISSFNGRRSICFTPSKDFAITSSSPPSISPRSPLRSTSTLSESMMEENLEQAESIITKWNPDTSSFAKFTSLFHESRREAKEFLKSINALQRAMHFFVSHHPFSEKLVRAQNLMQIAMKRLKKEFYQILSANRDYLDPEYVSARSSISRGSVRSSTSDHEDDAGSEDEIHVAGESISQVEQFSALAMCDLRSIAECMISSGYGKECVEIYKTMRKSIVDEALYKLGVERLSSSKIQKMDWEVLELKIKSWLNAVKIAVKSLFYGERIVCDHVLSASDSIRESCFSEITKEGAITLFGFPESVAKIHKGKSPEKMFRMLDLCELISELFPDIESIFSFESTSVIRSQALNSLINLIDAIGTMLLELESAINKDSSKSPIPGGGLHPLTRYVMNYLSRLTDYSRTLSDVVADWPLPEHVSLPQFYFESPNLNDNPSSLMIRLAWIILVLLCKLDRKAERYKDSALGYLFLTNNLQYVVKKVETSNLRYLLGEDWISKQEAKVKQYTASYERIGWSKVLSALSAITENPTATTISAEEAKDCFKNFNSAFEWTYRTQSCWVFKGRKLREEIKVSIAMKLMPRYRALYSKYRALLRTENDLGSIFRFTPDDLANHLSDLFYGTRASGSAYCSPAQSPRHCLRPTFPLRVKLF
ncbi:exocyst complex component EXO70H1-like [Macadamia integrifolia]|uniref:exocyst complex component EXO70H1-like n=1 Tax=Macadamia integrifolia TaxID=60698 RepID=UPI001C52BB94|nr:exocyst complex component EXO70H1-like [Macadamia integrifolia]